MTEIGAPEEDLRKQAIERLAKKREFAAHLIAYVMVNATLIAVWWMSEVSFFWPIFPLVAWGIGVVFHGWDTFARPPTEERIHREMDRLRTT